MKACRAAQIEELNKLMKELGYRTAFTALRGGWVDEHHIETGNHFKLRPMEVAEALRRRRAQLERQRAKTDNT